MITTHHWDGRWCYSSHSTDDNPRKGEWATPGHTVGIRDDTILEVQIFSLWPETVMLSESPGVPGSSLKANRLEIQESW